MKTAWTSSSSSSSSNLCLLSSSSLLTTVTDVFQAPPLGQRKYNVPLVSRPQSCLPLIYQVGVDGAMSPPPPPPPPTLPPAPTPPPPSPPLLLLPACWRTSVNSFRTLSTMLSSTMASLHQREGGREGTEGQGNGRLLKGLAATAAAETGKEEEWVYGEGEKG